MKSAGVPTSTDAIAPPVEHLANQLDDVVHQRFRLGILAFLTDVESVEFTTLRKALSLTDGNLNRHLAILSDAGFVAIDKPTETGRRTKTWVHMTPTGRSALAAHVTALREMLANVDRPTV